MSVYIAVGIVVLVLVALIIVIGVRASKLMVETGLLEERCKVLGVENNGLRMRISSIRGTIPASSPVAAVARKPIVVKEAAEFGNTVPLSGRVAAPSGGA